MYTTYTDDILQDELGYEERGRTSNIQLAPTVDVLLFMLWLTICFFGFGVMYIGGNALAGAIIIAVPTFVGMVIKPSFALCIMMLVLPTGAGIRVEDKFSLDRGVGIVVAVSFILNLLITRPRLRIGNMALWVLMVFTVWVLLVSMAGPYVSMEFQRASTLVQSLALILITYWILETNSEKVFRWALRTYVAGSVGTILITFLTGTAMQSVEDTGQGRYAATLGKAVEPNMLAAMTALALLAVIYLLVRDRNIFLRIVYLAAIVFLPLMLLRMGSRGVAVALGITLLSPLLFVRQVIRRPGLIGLLAVIIVLVSLSSTFLIGRQSGFEGRAVSRFTDVQYAKQSLDYRVSIMKGAVGAALKRPTGTGYYSWFERTGLAHLPHSDFFLALGVYGIPGAVLFVVFMAIMMLTVKRMPLGIEKLYARAILIFLLVLGFSMTQIFLKYMWIFLAIIMASVRISRPTMNLREPVSTTETEEVVTSAQD